MSSDCINEVLCNVDFCNVVFGSVMEENGSLQVTVFACYVIQNEYRCAFQVFCRFYSAKNNV